MERIGTNVSSREILEKFLHLSPSEALGINGKEFKSAVLGLVLQINSDGSEVIGRTSFGEKVAMSWVRDNMQEPACLFFEGEMNGKSTCISIDWRKGESNSNPLAFFSMVSEGEEPIHIANFPGYIAKMSEEYVNRAVEGAKWLISGLLNWDSGNS